MVEQRSRRVFLFIGIFSLLLNFTLGQQELLSSSVEKLALLQLRSSLCIRSTHWPIKLEPCLFWEGIQCNNSHVVGINISNFKRTRAGSRKAQFSVNALQNFTLLISLNASGFTLPGLIPEWFGLRLASLQVLDLSSCSIVGSIPSSIGNLSSLISLYLSSSYLSRAIPVSLSQLTSLEVLDISKNSLSGIIPDAFTYMGNLTSLDMSFNNLSGIIPHGIGALSKLEYLNLSRNNLSSSIPAQLGDLSNLVDLDLGFNSLSGPVPPDLRELRNLRRLLIGNNMLSGPLPLNLFAPSNPLQFVVLSHNAFTGPLPDLWSLAQLKYFDASGNNMTGVLPMLGFNANTTAAVFNLSWNLFYGSLDTIIQGVSFVDLSGNYFEGKLPNDAQRKMSVAQNVSEQRSLGECTLYYSDRGLMFEKFAIQIPLQPGLLPLSEKKSYRTLIILVTVLGSAGVILILVVLLFLVIVCTRRRSAINQKGIGIDQGPAGVSLKVSYQLISKAADEFKDKNLVKNGHSGDLFHGTLEGGIPVVIKRVDLRLVKQVSYMTELNFISKVSHTRFVPLLGYCLENKNEKFLVYKYMPNAALSASLYKKTTTDDDSLQSLDWITRLKIAIGAAEGLSYLHHECSPPFVHRNVQASSILLDDGFEVCIGSLSEACIHEGDNLYSRITRLLHLHQTTEHGSSGTKTSTCAYDVYCFGKVLLELVTGKLG